MKKNSRKQKKIYYADTETTTFDEENGVKIYLWCIIDDEDNEYFNFDVKSLYNFLSKTDGIFYFHNLKFDFSYLEYYMLKHNIKYSINERNGVIYRVKFGNCELRDSMNLINLSLDEIGKTYCEKYQKTKIDYESADYYHEATTEEIEYCLNDCYVLREGLQNWKKNLIKLLENNNAIQTSKQVDKKLTYAGIAFEAFKELSVYEKSCPKTTVDEYRLLSPAYRGGYVYSKPCGILKDIMMIDCNSIYPYIYMTKRLPYGNGYKCLDYNKILTKDFYVININISFNLKPNYIPIIGGGIGKYGGTLYHKTTNGKEMNITICRYDWELIQEFYDFEFTYNWGYWWNTKANFYLDYGTIFMNEKKQAKTQVVRNLAKMMLNSPYGKTAMNGLSEIRNYFIDEDEKVKSNIIGYDLDKKLYQYIPQAISITAQARSHLLNTAKKIGFDNVYYMDTDSIKFDSKFVDLSTIWLDDKELGAWKDEGHPLFFKTIAPKKYIKYDNNKLEITCAGFSKKALTEQLYHGQTIDEKTAFNLMCKFDKGLSIDCLQSFKVKGGRALIKLPKSII